MKVYLVLIEDIDGNVSEAVCQDDKDLIHLVNNIDKSLYEIVAVRTGHLENDYLKFSKKQENLETGIK